MRGNDAGCERFHARGQVNDLLLKSKTREMLKSFGSHRSFAARRSRLFQ